MMIGRATEDGRPYAVGEFLAFRGHFPVRPLPKRCRRVKLPVFSDGEALCGKLFRQQVGRSGF